MNLTKVQQQQLTFLNKMFVALTRVSDQESVIQEMADHVSDFEQSMGGEVKIKLRFGAEPAVEVVDCSRDYLKLVRDKDTSNLRARVEGISFTGRIAYRDNYSFSNAAIVDALRALADNVEKLNIELCDQAESVDIFSLMGVSHANAEDEADEISGAGDLADVGEGAAKPVAAPSADAGDDVDEDTVISLSSAEGEDKQ